MATEPQNCEHKNYDLSWSNGECPRCKDCGTIGEFTQFPNITWGTDPLLIAIVLDREGNREGRERIVSYLALAKQQGFTAYDEQLKELGKSETG